MPPWNGSHCENCGQNVHFKDRGGMRSLWRPTLSSQVNQPSWPLNDLLQHLCPSGYRSPELHRWLCTPVTLPCLRLRAWLPCRLGCARALITPGATVARSTETEDQIMQDWCHDRYQYQRHSRPGHVDVKSRFNFIYTNVKCDMSYTASVVKRLAYFLFVSHGARQII